jgi:NAD-dependent dihydropyrimidine dehydrogenase PreA subunit
MTGLSYLRGVTTLELDDDLCTGCGVCEFVCPQAVIAVTDGIARIRDRDACMECGACATNCETDALTVRAGVGCAAAVISAAIGRDSTCCTAPTESPETTP